MMERGDELAGAANAIVLRTVLDGIPELVSVAAAALGWFVLDAMSGPRVRLLSASRVARCS